MSPPNCNETMSPLGKLRGDRVETERTTKGEGNRERGPGSNHGWRSEPFAATEPATGETAEGPLPSGAGGVGTARQSWTAEALGDQRGGEEADRRTGAE